ncbi:hypothetical protein Tco_0928164 [Tanacetum coccineum]
MSTVALVGKRSPERFVGDGERWEVSVGCTAGAKEDVRRSNVLYARYSDTVSWLATLELVVISCRTGYAGIELELANDVAV